MNDVTTLDPSRDESLRTIGHISYALHAVVAVGAVLPAFQPSVLLLVVAFILDMVKKNDAAGRFFRASASVSCAASGRAPVA